MEIADVVTFICISDNLCMSYTEIVTNVMKTYRLDEPRAAAFVKATLNLKHPPNEQIS